MTFSYCLIISLAITSVWSLSYTKLPKYAEEINCDPSAPHLHLTLNHRYMVELDDNTIWRSIIINWKPPANVKPTDWVGIFRLTTGKIGVDVNAPYERKNVTSNKPGRFWCVNKIFDSFIKHENEIIHGCALHYGAAYIQDNKPIMINCLKFRPNWMENEKDVIGDIPLHKLMIPGTRNSAFINDLANKDKNLRKHVFQSESIWKQLNYGIRYFDIEVAYLKNSEAKFYAVNFKLMPLKSLMFNFVDFTDRTKEVVIVEFSRFHKFDQNVFKEFEKEFSIPNLKSNSASSLTYNKMLNQLKKKIIVTYRESNPNLNTITRYSTKTSDPSMLIDDITDARSLSLMDTSSGFSAAMLTLTGTKWYKDDQAEMSCQLAPKIPPAIHTPFWQEHMNIIATDFFLGNNVIEESIMRNRRLKCKDICH